MTQPSSEPRLIRFIDSQYNNLFFLPDGERIRLTNREGHQHALPCTYLDAYHTQIGNYIYHICEFAERMEKNGTRYAPDKPLNLPDYCYALHPGTDELILLRKGQRGYKVSPFSTQDKATNQREADRENGLLCVGRQQVQQMLDGAFKGWGRSAPTRKHSNHER